MKSPPDPTELRGEVVAEGLADDALERLAKRIERGELAPYRVDPTTIAASDPYRGNARHTLRIVSPTADIELAAEGDRVRYHVVSRRYGRVMKVIVGSMGLSAIAFFASVPVVNQMPWTMAVAFGALGINMLALRKVPKSLRLNLEGTVSALSQLVREDAAPMRMRVTDDAHVRVGEEAEEETSDESRRARRLREDD